MLLVVLHDTQSGGQKSRFYSKTAFKEDRSFFFLLFQIPSSENKVAGEEAPEWAKRQERHYVDLAVRQGAQRWHQHGQG